MGLIIAFIVGLISFLVWAFAFVGIGKTLVFCLDWLLRCPRIRSFCIVTYYDIVDYDNVEYDIQLPIRDLSIDWKKEGF